MASNFQNIEAIEFATECIFREYGEEGDHTLHKDDLHKIMSDAMRHLKIKKKVSREDVDDVMKKMGKESEQFVTRDEVSKILASSSWLLASIICSTYPNFWEYLLNMP